MKTVFDKTTRLELIARINKINENYTAQWGKMNVFQMLKHCTLWDEWMNSNKKNKQVFIGRLFGKLALNIALKDEKPLRRNSPTSSEFIIKEKSGNLEFEKQKWIKLIEGYENFHNPNFVHIFFGKMSKEQIGYLAYKHSDHHLRQFNA